MRNKFLMMVLFVSFSLGITVSCSLSKDSETENLKKEVEALKKEREDEKASKEKEATQQEASTPSTAATPKQVISPPVGSTVAFSNAGNVVVRDSPSLQARKVGGLKKGERVFVIEESNNTDEWKGTEANWALIQKENGQRGWVFTPFISYER